jgi:predicted ATP-grasp superfamily ATP-dependent carboligase
VRNLGRQGIPTIVLDAKKNQAAFSSKYTKGIVCPHPKCHEEEYINFLVSIGEQLPLKGVLIPTGDTETLAILRHRKRLEQYYHFTMAEYETVNTLINKKRFYTLLEKQDVPHPTTFFPHDENEVKTVSTSLSYPCIVKPVYPTYFRLDFHTKLFIANSPKDLIMLYKKAHEKNHEMMFQEIIPGTADSMFGYNAYYDQASKPHGMFMYQRIREWPQNFGNGCFLRHVKEPNLEHITTPLLKSLHYYGVVDAEFKRDPRDGVFKFIEINPRVWMQNSFPTRYGCNLPYLAYQDALGNPLQDEVSHSFDESVKWVYFFEDIQSSRVMMKKKELSMHAWVQAYRFKNEHSVFAWDDPLPFLQLGAQSVKSLSSIIMSGTSESKKHQ